MKKGFQLKNIGFLKIYFSDTKVIEIQVSDNFDFNKYKLMMSKNLLPKAEYTVRYRGY